MKIGFSFGRCLRDIVNGTVPYEEVYLIVTRTHITDSTHIDPVIEEYLHRPDYLMGLDASKCYEIGTKLYLDGRLLQPRIQGKQPRMVAENAVWMDIAPTIHGEAGSSEQVIKAWKNYQLALKMTSLDKFGSTDHLRDNF